MGGISHRKLASFIQMRVWKLQLFSLFHNAPLEHAFPPFPLKKTLCSGTQKWRHQSWKELLIKELHLRLPEELNLARVMENWPGNGLNLIFKSLNKWKALLLSTVLWGDQSPGLDFLLTQMSEESLLLWFLAPFGKQGYFLCSWALWVAGQMVLQGKVGVELAVEEKKIISNKQRPWVKLWKCYRSC